MPWLFLVLAGLLEVGWAVGLKFTDGFRRPLPSLLVAASMAGSVVLLSWAARSIPIGTAYAVWVGIGAVGTVLVGILFFEEPLGLLRMLLILGLVACIAGLKALG